MLYEDLHVGQLALDFVCYRTQNNLYILNTQPPHKAIWTTLVFKIHSPPKEMQHLVLGPLAAFWGQRPHVKYYPSIRFFMHMCDVWPKVGETAPVNNFTPFSSLIPNWGQGDSWTKCCVSFGGECIQVYSGPCNTRIVTLIHDCCFEVTKPFLVETISKQDKIQTVSLLWSFSRCVHVLIPPLLDCLHWLPVNTTQKWQSSFS